MSETEFLNPILNSVINIEDERQAFAIQNTLYAICIILNAAIQNEAIYAKGVVAIDDVAYECKGNAFPADLIARYGFWRTAEGYHLETAQALFWPCVTIMLDMDAEYVEKIEQRIDSELTKKPEWNYYGAAISTADLQGEWLLRAQGLLPAVAAVAEVPDTSASAPTDPVETKSAVRKNLRGAKHTRRTHGRRALTPPRTNRLTAFTRSHK
jgi:hypothetical protein